jgi:HK97 gp10 family phage protein
MPLAFDISMLGDVKLERMLAKLHPTVQRKIGRKASRRAFTPIKKAIVANTPVLTGALKEGIKLRALKRSTLVFGHKVLTPERADLGLSDRGPGDENSSYYPFAVEYGHGNVPAVRFMRDAYDKNENRALSLFRANLFRGIEEAAKK